MHALVWYVYVTSRHSLRHTLSVVVVSQRVIATVQLCRVREFRGLTSRCLPIHQLLNSVASTATHIRVRLLLYPIQLRAI